MDGVVLKGDLERVEGALVNTGDTLFEIAPTLPRDDVEAGGTEIVGHEVRAVRGRVVIARTRVDHQARLTIGPRGLRLEPARQKM